MNNSYRRCFVRSRRQFVASSTYSPTPLSVEKLSSSSNDSWAAHLAPFILPTPALDLIIISPRRSCAPKPLQSLSHTSAPSRHFRGIRNLPSTAVKGFALQPSGSTHLLDSHHPHQHHAAPPLPFPSIRRRYKHLASSICVFGITEVLHLTASRSMLIHPLLHAYFTVSLSLPSDHFPHGILLSPLKNQQVAFFK